MKVITHPYFGTKTYFDSVRKWVTWEMTFRGITQYVEHKLVSIDYEGAGTVVCKYLETPIRFWSNIAKRRLFEGLYK